MTKIVLLGFDGASLGKIESLVGQGKLPSFGEFMTEGCVGTMTTTIPPTSAPAWASLATGMNPGEHGIFFFLNREGHVVLSDRIAGKAVWDLIGNSGKKVIILNMPMTYPPYPVNGIMVSGMPCPYNTPKAYPPDLATELNEEVPGYQVESSYKEPNYEGMDRQQFFEELCNVTRKRLDMTLYLMSEYPWDFFAVVFTSLDRVQHVFWDDPSHLLEYYSILDSVLDQLDQTNDTATFVVSDHGFESCNQVFGINNWLEQHGLLERTKLASREKTYNFLSKLRRTLPENVRWRIPARLRKKTRLPAIDFSNTLAYSPYSGAIISPSLRVRKRVKKLLFEERFVERVYEKEELYTGDCVGEAADLLLMLKDGYESRAWAEDVIENKEKVGGKRTHKTGTHQGISAQKAVFMAKGGSIKKGCAVDLNIIDIAPTILKLMDLKIPSAMEGRALEIFT